jgi:hypothetical protein
MAANAERLCARDRNSVCTVDRPFARYPNVTRAKLYEYDLDFVANLCHMRAPCLPDAAGKMPPSNYISGMMRKEMRRIRLAIVALSAAGRSNHRSSRRGRLCAMFVGFPSQRTQPGQGLRQPD